MRAARNIAEACAAITARDKRPVRFVDLVGVFWIDNQVSEIKRTPDHVLTAIEFLPRLAGIIRAIEPVLRNFGFDERINRGRFGRSNGNSDTTPGFCRQPLTVLSVKFGPRGAPVGALE